MNRLTLIKFFSISLVLFLLSCSSNKTHRQKRSSAPDSCLFNLEPSHIISKLDGKFEAHRTNTPVKIDGCGKDAIWTKVQWYDMNFVWMGKKVDSIDYYGKFKLAWDNKYLYVLVEVVDDYLNPTLGDGLENYWKGDYVEVFIDEDKSGGNHQYNHQAFAYHISTEGHAIDKSTTKATIFFDDHVEVKRLQEGTRHLWEMAIKLFDNQFDENSKKNKPVKVTNQKNIGFSIAYGDNDGKNNRENFMGSKKTHGINNDEGYVNSDVFGSLVFIE